MKLSEHYYAVLASLEDQRAQIDATIAVIGQLADKIAEEEMRQTPMPPPPQSGDT